MNYGPLVGFQVGSIRGRNAIIVLEASGQIEAAREYQSGGWHFQSIKETQAFLDCPYTIAYFDKDEEITRERVVPGQSPAADELDAKHVERLISIDEYFQFELAAQQSLMEELFHGDKIPPRVQKEIVRASLEQELKVAAAAVSQSAPAMHVA